MTTQTGSLRQQHGAWFFRYYTEERDAEGRRKQITKRLAPVCDEYRSAKDLRPLILAELAAAGQDKATIESGLTVAEFADAYWLPAIEKTKKPSTYKFYKDIFENHLRAAVGDIRLRTFRTVDAQKVLDSISLSHQSLLRIKTGMQALFGHAIRQGFLTGTNVVREAKAGGTRSNFEGIAYTAADIQWMLSKLTGTARVVVAVAAFTGLRLAELRGLQWSDFDGSFLWVRRSVWRKNIGETKTPESKAKVPVIAPLRKVLDAHRKNSTGTWIFQGVKNGFALHLDNLTRREIHPALGDRWRGWHAFRRGLATVLFDLGVDAEVASLILRHSDSAVTRRHYIKLQSQREGAAAMKRLEQSLKVQ